MVTGVVNFKGGVAKTTTSLALTDAFTQMGYKTLLIDFDPQANASKVFLMHNATKTIYDGLMRTVPIEELVVTGNQMGDIIPSSGKLKNILGELISATAGECRLKNILVPLKQEYEIIIIDSGPSSGIMMNNVLTASDGIIIPMEPETFAIDGLAALLENVNDIRETLNPDLKIYGVLLTRYNKSKSIQKDISKQFKEIEAAGVHTFKTVIRDSAAIPKIQSFMNVSEPESLAEKKVLESQGSIFKYGVNNGAVDYSNFAKELLGVISNGE